MVAKTLCCSKEDLFQSCSPVSRQAVPAVFPWELFPPSLAAPHSPQCVWVSPVTCPWLSGTAEMREWREALLPRGIQAVQVSMEWRVTPGFQAFQDSQVFHCLFPGISAALGAEPCRHSNSLFRPFLQQALENSMFFHWLTLSIWCFRYEGSHWTCRTHWPHGQPGAARTTRWESWAVALPLCSLALEFVPYM